MRKLLHIDPIHPPHCGIYCLSQVPLYLHSHLIKWDVHLCTELPIVLIRSREFRAAALFAGTLTASNGAESEEGRTGILGMKIYVEQL